MWFWIIAALFTLYFFLEGFDFGVDMLRPLLARNEREERALTGTIGPFWDGNEVWVIAAAGAMFSTFPRWYGALFSGMYPIFVIILLALIVRGVSFEFRNQVDRPRWRAFWDAMSFWGSLVPAFLWGVVMANLLRGLPISAEGEFVGSPLLLFNPFALLGGLATALMFVLHGANFLLLRLHHEDEIYHRARRAALFWGALATVAVLGFVVAGYISTGLFRNFGLLPWLFPIAAFLTLITIWYALVTRRSALGFAMSGLTVAFSTLTIFLGLYPNVAISTLDPANTLTVQQAASQPYTLHLMNIVAAIFLPLIVAYQIWNYYVFRQRVRVERGGLDQGY
nr:cytochrome d ubiquinol oxidase subunit II [Deinobacterium chartae]